MVLKSSKIYLIYCPKSKVVQKSKIVLIGDRYTIPLGLDATLPDSAAARVGWSQAEA